MPIHAPSPPDDASQKQADRSLPTRAGGRRGPHQATSTLDAKAQLAGFLEMARHVVRLSHDTDSTQDRLGPH